MSSGDAVHRKDVESERAPVDCEIDEAIAAGHMVLPTSIFGQFDDAAPAEAPAATPEARGASVTRLPTATNRPIPVAIKPPPADTLAASPPVAPLEAAPVAPAEPRPRRDDPPAALAAAAQPVGRLHAPSQPAPESLAPAPSAAPAPAAGEPPDLTAASSPAVPSPAIPSPAAPSPAPASPFPVEARRALLVALVGALPPVETSWSLDDRIKWLEAAASVFDLAYSGGEGPAAVRRG